MRRPVAIALALLVPGACAPRRAQAPVSLVLLDIGHWGNPDYAAWSARAVEGFTRETGIAVERLPAPTFTDEQLVLARRILEVGGKTPDVYVVDTTWPGVLADHLLDLTALVRTETAAHFPALVANNVVRGRMVALPYHANVGILLYRTDLLKEYGFDRPPATWNDLTTMAAAIQKGERAKGRSDFWGFVWQGAPYEGLTCNALEWQASEGGGRIIEDDGSISVNNPRAIRAWERAAGWIGVVSPPQVIGFHELEAESLWRSGRAALLRSWPGSYRAATQGAGSAVRGRFATAPVPSGSSGHASVLGENALAVSRYSSHAAEALALVKYLARRDVQLARSRTTSVPPTIADLYDEPVVQAAHPEYATIRAAFAAGVVSRPSSVSGTRYADVSRAYYRAVHSVLTRERSGAEAASALERELKWITGLPAARPAP
jgi:trehalose/maltose transport system substrate-binding protein